MVSQEQEEAIREAVAPPMQGSAPPPPPPKGSEDMLSEALNSLVSDGTISEDQEEDIFDALFSYAADNSDNEDAGSTLGDALDGLVSSGIISAEQQSAIEDALLDSFARIIGL